ncbi:MAG: hypothetical protein GY810_01130 [Aureispira sp.]|nr:hypothetical protein [Aureispira sp.]
MKSFAVIVTAVSVAVGVSFIFSYPLMLLWNGCLVPAIPGILKVTWMQMWGLSVLISFLFSGTVSSK